MTKSEYTLLILKAINKHYYNNIADLPVYPLGLAKEEDNSAWVEVRVVGPDYQMGDGSSFTCSLTVSLLISTKISELDDDFNKHIKNVSKATVPFEKDIVYIGSTCLEQVGKIITRHYGSTDKENLVTRSIIEGNYQIVQEY